MGEAVAYGLAGLGIGVGLVLGVEVVRWYHRNIPGGDDELNRRDRRD